MRIGITGAPRTGKTTLAPSFGLPVYCCDPPWVLPILEEGVQYPPARLVKLPMKERWGAVSQYIADYWLSHKYDCVIEGVGLVRALRRYRKDHRFQRPPIDRLIVLRDPHIPLNDGQATMGDQILRHLSDPEFARWIGHLVEWR